MIPDKTGQIFTIGHSDNSIGWFIDRLRQYDITALADVRSSPYSRFAPQFNREILAAALCATHIHYVPLSDELGARRIEPECYAGGKAKYDLIAKAPLFHRGLRRVQTGAERYRIALMCAEKDPITCHRAILICRHLKPLGIPISHILPDGELETTEAMEQRLLRITGNSESNLFMSNRNEAIDYAYDIQGDRIAYRIAAAMEDGG